MNRIENYLTVLGLLCSLFLSAQQIPNMIILQSQGTEPDVPSLVDPLAKQALKHFEKIVQFLADKNNSYPAKVQEAESFAKKFKPEAIIEVMNGKKKTRLSPLDYFYRVIDLDYEQVKIDFELEKNNGSERIAQNQYKAQYLIKQNVSTIRKDGVVYADYTIKTVDMFFIYTPQTKTWDKQYGNVFAKYNQRTK